MITVDVPISDLKPHPQNPRRGNVDLIVDSIKAHGVYRPVIANSRNNTIIAGHHLVQAATELGHDTIPVVWIDADEGEHIRLMIMDNRSADLGDYDILVLTELLGALDYPTFGTGYLEEDIEDLFALIEPPTNLDDLVKDVGEPQEEDLWPLLSFKIPPLLLSQWREHEKKFNSPASALASLLGVEVS